MGLAGLLAGIGDGAAQLWLERKRLRDYDVLRTGRFVGVTSLWIAPILVPWLRFLQHRVRGSAALAPLKRVLLDQVPSRPFRLLHAGEGRLLVKKG